MLYFSGTMPSGCKLQYILAVKLCVLLLTVVPLPPGKTPFAVQLNNIINIWSLTASVV
jgi:hypothetical protein